MPKTTNPFARTRATPSPLKKRPLSRPSKTPASSDLPADRLDDNGNVPSLCPRGVAQDVLSLVEHIRDHAFADVPERAAGMNSERISDVLRFRQGLPPIVTVAHIFALSSSSTQTEREIARLVAAGTMRKIIIPGRGRGGSAVGEGIVLVEAWKKRVREDVALDDALKEKYMALMDSHPASFTVPTTSFTEGELRKLVSTSFLTFPSALSSVAPGDLLSLPGASSLLAISKAGSSAATGSLGAIGGQGAVHEAGGGGSTLATKDTRVPPIRVGSEMTFSLPGTGVYLKLLVEARQHLLRLLKQISPRHREATWELLREKWQGNVLNDAISKAKRARGEFSGVLPGKTKIWKDFYGMEYEWIVEECVGSGVLECFDTGSVGIALRGR